MGADGLTKKLSSSYIALSGSAHRFWTNLRGRAAEWVHILPWTYVNRSMAMGHAVAMLTSIIIIYCNYITDRKI